MLLSIGRIVWTHEKRSKISFLVELILMGQLRLFYIFFFAVRMDVFPENLAMNQGDTFRQFQEERSVSPITLHNCLQQADTVCFCRTIIDRSIPPVKLNDGKGRE